MLKRAFDQGRQAALGQFKLAYSPEFTPLVAGGGAGAAAGALDLLHGRGLMGSLGSALGTGAGGALGYAGGQSLLPMLGGALNLPPSVQAVLARHGGNIGGIIGALLGRKATQEREHPHQQLP